MHQAGDLYRGLPAVDCAPHFIPRQWSAGTHHLPQGGKVLYGTYWAQQQIWRHQNPISCRSNSTRFMVFVTRHDTPNGIGSTIHVSGQALSTAMALGRILILDINRTFWHRGKFCRGMRSIDQCYFEPMSSCTLEDAMFVEATYGKDATRYVQWHEWLTGHQSVPEAFFDLLSHSGIPRNKWYYWWRAQAAAYLVRPTSRMKYALHQRRTQIFGLHAQLPPGCIAVHVRRGDKVTEAPKMLLSDAPFFDGAAGIYANRTRTGTPLSPSIYLSTEDSQTVEQFQRMATGQGQRFLVLSTNVSRFHERRSPIAHANIIGHDIEFLNSFVSLELSLQCSGFVVALVSNWGRLIDELRATIMCKAHLPLFDPEQPGAITDLNW